ncbi:MAG: hypothetical protein J2O46_05375, partial [Nocardioides sp.]|nr:hypothetical protein [Nocardioides sp.]
MSEAVSRMTSGDWYLDEPELAERRQRCWRLLDRFNSAGADEHAEREAALSELLREHGHGAT